MNAFSARTATATKSIVVTSRKFSHGQGRDGVVGEV